MNSSICPICNTPITEADAAKVCPSCGVAHHEACWTRNGGCSTYACPQKTHAAAPVTQAVCSNCGTSTEHKQPFCPTCGNFLGQPAPAPSPAFSQANPYNYNEEKKSKAPLFIGIGIAGGLLLIILLIVFWPVSVDRITISEGEELFIDAGETDTLHCEIYPSDASDTEVTWTSSNHSVATVDSNGKVTGQGQGLCTITAEADDKTDTITVYVTDHKWFAVGTWKPVGYLQNGEFYSLPSYTGNLYIYDDSTGVMYVSGDSYSFYWEYSYYSSDSQTYLYRMNSSSLGELTFGISEIDGEDCLMILVGDMTIVYQE